MNEYYVGIDLGGTNIKAGVVDGKAKVMSQVSIPTEGGKGRAQVLQNICKATELAIQKSGVPVDAIRALGIGSPGVLDLDRGVVVFAPNLPDWKEVPLVKILEDRFKKPAALENDANAAAWGEFWAGAGRSVKSMVMLTLGTGVGGGIIIDGQLLHGHKAAAAELGHISIDYRGRKCACGSVGCIEAYASADSVVRRFVEAVQAGQKTVLAERVKQGKPVTTKMIFQAALDGDEFCRRAIEEAGELLGVAIASIVHTLNPQLVVISGGMSNAGEMLMKPLKRIVWARSWARALEDFEIQFATLGEDAGFVGAAGCALNKFATSAL